MKLWPTIEPWLTVPRFVDNLTDPTQWTTTLRNSASFLFAQEQMIGGRAGLGRIPGGFRRYQPAISAVGNMANSYADGNGNRYITFPGSGWPARARRS